MSPSSPSTVRLGLQTITWGDGQFETFPHVFDVAARGGYGGVEIGYRRIQSTPPDVLQRLLDAQGLSFVATHAGGNLEDPAQAGEERRLIDDLLAYVKAMGSDLLMFSGLRYENDTQIAADIAQLNRMAELCARQGVHLLYHNHNWEFAGGGKTIRAILDQADETVGFCPDVGWLYKARVEIVPFLESIRPRIGAIHFKDFASLGPGVDTVVLGKGVIPLEQVAAWINQAGFEDLWVIAEQDNAVGGVDEDVLGNGAFLQRAFAGHVGEGMR